MNNTLGEKKFFPSVGPTSGKVNFITTAPRGLVLLWSENRRHCKYLRQPQSQVYNYLYTDICSKAAFLVETLRKDLLKTVSFKKHKPAVNQLDGHGSNGELAAYRLKDKTIDLANIFEAV